MSRISRCQGCGAELSPKAVICIDCGLNQKTGQQLRTVRQPVRHQWCYGPGSHWSYPAVLPFGVVIYGMIQYLQSKQPRAMPLPLPITLLALAVSVLLFALGMGTYCRLTLMRNREGKLLITRKRFLAFVPMETRTVDLRKYKTVRLWSPLDPIAQVTRFTAELVSERGDPSFIVYRGIDDKQMSRIAETLKEVANLEIVR